ncbi:hypothetical protein A2685_02940 [Candidatus Woesebacteria bacterium RIFCSPHIGHO2_01_FULL_37_10]|uniref:Exonuclease domain-containing protein n=1 Tax=Candidatus Woesebacteria bacterium RIFCSPHIGHO2_01_FULL_37_10 TaxID=1802489 RepID=A0A1F7XSU0_9BACT|nr:MAG: hypothetical protein A2685_02940 [Candidatus Woesebacteria bacterium RIFCSPHIGHO2_01_FULL_37_10]
MHIIPDHHKKGKKPKDFRDRKLIFIDLEMTGSDPAIHEIIEVGWLVVDGRSYKILSEYEAKVRPEHLYTADKEGLRVAGYSENKWKKPKDLKFILNKLAKVAPNAMLAGWSVFADWQFLERGFEKFKIKPKFNYRLLVVDSVAYAKLYKEKKLTNFSMRTGVAKLLNIPYSVEHGALKDAKLSYEVFKKLMEL